MLKTATVRAGRLQAGYLQRKAATSEELRQETKICYSQNKDASNDICFKINIKLLINIKCI
jgi:hypothetical protein